MTATSTTAMTRDDALTLALDWAARGVPAFPVRIRWDDTKGKTEKAPAVAAPGFRNASIDHDELVRMFANAGLKAGEVIGVGLWLGPAGLVAVDIDSPDAHDAIDALARPIPDTTTVETCSGMFHLWFAKPPDALIGNAHTLGDGIDVRADDGYVVAPGTWTPWGSWDFVNPYVEVPPAPLPDKIAAHLTFASDEPRSRGRWHPLDEANLHPATARALGALRQLGAHNEYERDGIVYVTRPGKDAAAGTSASIGWSAPGSVYVWSSAWPPFQPNHTYSVDDVCHVAKHGTAERNRLLDHVHRDMAVIEIPRPDALVDDLLFRPGESVLFAPPKMCKSFMALDFTLSVVTGIPFMGRDVTQGRVVYVAAEGVGGLGVRVNAWCGYHRKTLDGAAFLTTAINLFDAGSLRALVDFVTDEQPILVVFDTLARCAVGADENSAKDMGTLVDALDTVRDAIPRGHVLVVHHAGKDPTKGMRGSSALLGAVDTVIELSGDTKALKATVTAQKDAEPAPSWHSKLERYADSCVLTPLGGDAVASVTQRTVLAALCALPPEDRASTKWKDMAEGMGVGKSAFYVAKSALLADGVVGGGGGRGALYEPRDDPHDGTGNPW